LSELDELVRSIRAKRPELSQEEVLSLVAERREKSGGLLSEMGAAQLVAHDLLLELEAKQTAGVKLSTLVPGLNDVNVGARIVAQWPTQTFDKVGGRKGALMRLLLADETGSIQCVLWNSKALKLEKMGEITGTYVKILHAYTRQALFGNVELHCGDKGEVVPLKASGINEVDIFTRLSNLRPEARTVNIKGVTRSSRAVAFKRGGSEGKLVRLTLWDETGTVEVVGWDDRAALLEAIPAGTAIEFVGARVKTNARGLVEVHVDKMTLVRVLGVSNKELGPPLRLKIDQLRAGVQASLIVKVLATTNIAEVMGRTGEPIRLRSLLVGDSTGICEVSLWDERAKESEQLRVGDIVILEDVLVKERLGTVTVSVGSMGRIVLGEELENPGSPPFNKLVRLEEGSLALVDATIISKDEMKVVTTAKGETVQMASLVLSDETGQTRATFWREQASEVDKLAVGSRLRVYGLRCRRAMDGSMELASTQLTRIEVSST